MHIMDGDGDGSKLEMGTDSSHKPPPDTTMVFVCTCDGQRFAALASLGHIAEFSHGVAAERRDRYKTGWHL